MEWARWYSTAKVQIGYWEGPDGLVISTRFMGIAHSPLITDPELFQTALLDSLGGTQIAMHFYTWKHAAVAHKHMVEKSQQAIVAGNFSESMMPGLPIPG